MQLFRTRAIAKMELRAAQGIADAADTEIEALLLVEREAFPHGSRCRRIVALFIEHASAVIETGSEAHVVPLLAPDRYRLIVIGDRQSKFSLPPGQQSQSAERHSGVVPVSHTTVDRQRPL